MRRTLFYLRRTLAAVLALVVIGFVAIVVVAAVKEPLGGSILILLLALLGGLLFLCWLAFRTLGRVIRFVAGPSRRGQTSGLGSDYEQMVRAQARRGWHRSDAF
jgi:hypothetical protein